MKVFLSLVLLLFVFSDVSAQKEIIVLNDTNNGVAAQLEMQDYNGDDIPEFALLAFDGLHIYSIEEMTSNSWNPNRIGPSFNTVNLNLNSGDLDNDGDLDIFTIGHEGLSLYFNAGNSDFEVLKFDIPQANSIIREIGLGDIDGDGDPDLCTAFESKVIWIENIDAWESFKIHEIHTSADMARGAIAIDWELDGDMDILEISAVHGAPLRIHLQEYGIWTWKKISGTSGGAFSLDFADIDNDNIEEIGISAQSGPIFINNTTNNVQSVSGGNAFPEGGQFYNYNGSSIWIQVNYPNGQIIYCVFDENGIAGEIIDSDVFIPFAHDFKIYDADKNGSDDLFFCGFNTNYILSVIPDFELPLNPLINTTSEIDEVAIALSYHEGALHGSYPRDTNLKQINIYNLSGQLLFQKDIDPFQNEFVVPVPLNNGIYVAEFNANDNRVTRKFWAGQ